MEALREIADTLNVSLSTITRTLGRPPRTETKGPRPE